MMAISSCVTSELPRAPGHDEEEVEGTAPASFLSGVESHCLRTVRTLSNYFPFLEQPHFSLLLLFPGS